jgi:hypothetical protein
MEIKYKLQSFGIPMDLFPIDDDSKLLGLTDFVARRSAIENERRVEQGSRILAPGKLDILLGRGKPNQVWCGNLQLATILLENEYRRNTVMNRRGAKNLFSRYIVDIIKGSGGRFLKREKGAMEWIEVDDIIAQEKVNNGFRNQRQLLAKAMPVEELLAVASPPNVHCGEKRPRPMDAT